MTVAVYSGSFDPITLGHLDVVRRALKVFDEIVFAIGVNQKKTPMFTGEERTALLNQAIREDEVLRAQAGRIQIKQTSGLLADFAQTVEANAIIRGVRSAGEFESETTMGLLNRQLTGIETVLLIADPTLSHISSSAVKEIAAFGGSVEGMVPEVVVDAIAKKFGGGEVA